MRWIGIGLAAMLPFAAGAESWDGRSVVLETVAGEQFEIAALSGDGDSYAVTLNDAAFTDHFLSMRPFKCIEGPAKTWCHVPYPYAIARDTSQGLTDLEYDFLFVWKGRSDYGIDMWNGVYYVLEPDGDGFVGRMHEMNMDMLAVPPEDGEMRPIRDVHLEETDPESHWLPVLRITGP